MEEEEALPLQPAVRDGGNSSAKPEDVPAARSNALLYRVDQTPPWYLCLILGFQHYLTMFGATIGIPFILSTHLCFADKPLVICELIGTIFFASGVVTLLQTSVGVRLPIVQGGTFTFLAPTAAIMAFRGACPGSAVHGTSVTAVTASIVSTASSMASSNFSLHATSTVGPFPAADEEWRIRMREVQGAIMVASLAQIGIGFGGLMGLMLKYIGPLTITPTVVLVGLPLFDTAGYFAGAQWGVALLTMFCIALFSQVLKDVKVLVPACSRKRVGLARIEAFKLFPILLAILVCWLLSAILTVSGALPAGSRARTDYRLSVLSESKWFRFPYPGQWGRPTVTPAAAVGMLAGVLASMIESIGDYYACARLSGAPPPPRHAVNRGLGVEGIGCLLTGAWGTGNGTTSYSENIGAIGVTRVGSVRVIQAGAGFMILLSLLGKFGALFTTIPDPIIGGIFIVMFGMIASVGLSSLHFVDLQSVRNLFVLGFSIFMGMVVPHWVKNNTSQVSLGVPELDQIVRVLLSTNMAVGGLTGFILDNAIPGTAAERGIVKWRHQHNVAGSDHQEVASEHIYDVPVVTRLFGRRRICKYMPFLPYYEQLDIDALGEEMVS